MLAPEGIVHYTDHHLTLSATENGHAVTAWTAKWVTHAIFPPTTMLLNVRRKQQRAQRRTFRPKSINRSKAHRSMFNNAASLCALCLRHLSLTSTCLSISIHAPNNDSSDEESSSNRSSTSPSSPFHSSASSSTFLKAQEKDFDDLGYLHHNTDNLLGYLKHVRPNRSLYHMSTLT